MAKKHHASSRRHSEMKDAGMIREDHSAIANMPQEVIMKPWPKVSHGIMDERINDTISGIDRQMDRDESKGRAGMNPHKY